MIEILLCCLKLDWLSKRRANSHSYLKLSTNRGIGRPGSWRNEKKTCCSIYSRNFICDWKFFNIVLWYMPARTMVSCNPVLIKNNQKTITTSISCSFLASFTTPVARQISNALKLRVEYEAYDWSFGYV